MELKMEVYTPALELVGILEVQRSVLWESRAFSAGSFSVDSLITDESRALLVPENIVWIEGETAGIIEYVQQQAEEDGPYITVKGRDLTGILDRRILWGLYDLKGTVPDIMRRLVEDCCIHPARGDAAARVIPGLVLAEPDGTDQGPVIQVQRTGGALLEALELLGEAYQTAFGVRFHPQVPQMEFWVRRGTDRSTGQNANEPVFFSTELDDVLASEYTYNSENYKNVSLVAGEGEGKDRITVTVEKDVENGPQPPAPPVIERYTITLSADPEGGGTVTGGGAVEAGASVTVTAAPGDGYKFVAWKEGDAVASESASYTFPVNGSRTLVAVFAKASRLPEGYTEVEWIQPNATRAYLYLLPSINRENSLELDVSFTAVPSARRLLCENKTGYYSLMTQSDGTPRYMLGTASLYKITGATCPVHTKFSVIFNFYGKSVTWNGTMAAFTDTPNPGTMYLGCYYSNAIANVDVRFYEVRTRYQNNLRAQFIPCKNSAGTLGMYDIGGYYGFKAVSNSWLAGPAV